MKFNASLIYPDRFNEPDIFVQTVEAEDEYEACEKLFIQHNRDDRYDGKIRRSMSVGDMVLLEHYQNETWDLLKICLFVPMRDL